VATATAPLIADPTGVAVFAAAGTLKALAFQGRRRQWPESPDGVLWRLVSVGAVSLKRLREAPPARGLLRGAPTP
jgi:hypothetical protein